MATRNDFDSLTDTLLASLESSRERQRLASEKLCADAATQQRQRRKFSRDGGPNPKKEAPVAAKAIEPVVLKKGRVKSLKTLKR